MFPVPKHLLVGTSRRLQSRCSKM